MIVHIFTIKICGMVNETIISTYEIVNLRTILIFVGKKYFSVTKGGYLKCLRGFRGGSAKCLCSSTRGRGVKNALISVYVVCTQSLIAYCYVVSIVKSFKKSRKTNSQKI